MILGIELRRVWFIPFFVLVVVNRSMAAEEEMSTRYPTPFPSNTGGKYGPPTTMACSPPNTGIFTSGPCL